MPVNNAAINAFRHLCRDTSEFGCQRFPVFGFFFELFSKIESTGSKANDPNDQDIQEDDRNKHFFGI
jgi:hypothetical protein